MSFVESVFDVSGKVAVITGGSGILGSEMARGLVNAGAHVVILDKNRESLEKQVKDFLNEGHAVSGFACDVLDKRILEKTKDEIILKHKTIDILINAAGGNMKGATVNVNQTIFDLTIEDYKKVVDLNLHGTVLPSLVFGRIMADKGNGVIINISSMASSRAITRVVGYSAAKSGVENFTRWMAVEMAYKFGEGIRVNAIAPGFLLTDQNRQLLTNRDGSYTERAHTILAHTPFKRFGNPDELIGTVLWLSSEASRFITGIVVPIDGGFSAFSGV